MSTRFQPLQGIADAKTAQAFDQVSRALDSTISQPTFAARVDAIVNVNAGAVVRLSPRAAGQTAVLPTSDASNAGRDVVLLVSGLGTLTVTAATGLVNGANSRTYAAGFFTVVLTSDGAGNWLTDGFATSSVPGAAIGALTGEVTKPAGSAVLTVVRSTDFQASPWTERHAHGGLDPTAIL